MLKFFKHIGKVLLTGSMIAARKVGAVVSSLLNCAYDVRDYVVDKFKSPAHPLISAVKAMCLQRFFMFVGGLACVFLFEDARGDLTWFETMLTSAYNYVGNIATHGVKYAKEKLFSMWNTAPAT